jgi:hypothetical protein
LGFRLPFGANQRNQPLNRGLIRHRRPAKLHHLHRELKLKLRTLNSTVNCEL